MVIYISSFVIYLKYCHKIIAVCLVNATFTYPSGPVDHEAGGAALRNVILAEEAAVRVDAMLR